MILAIATAFYLAAGSALAEAIPEDPFNGAVQVLHFSFDEDEDRDYDGFPDDWTRRKGTGFPAYLNTVIDRNHSLEGEHSLRFQANGGKAILYSPLVRIDNLHSYVFQGAIRTEGLQHDAALISVSFLNHKRQRVQRFLSRPVSGTHRDWVRVRIGPMIPRDDVRFVVIGCHLVAGRKSDIEGDAWFDDLWLGKLPQMTLVTNFHTHFIQRSAPIKTVSKVSGLTRDRTYALRLEIVDSSNRRVAEKVFPLNSREQADQQQGNGDEPLLLDETNIAEEQVIHWELPPQEYGFYEVTAHLLRDGIPILEKQSSFAVMDLAKVRDRGEFGWSVRRPPTDVMFSELADIAAQAGINWFKYPLWKSVSSEEGLHSREISELFELLAYRRITPVGLLNVPPADLRSKFARDWNGVSEIFLRPPSFWVPSLEAVMARYSSSVRYWQLGEESDFSFVGLGNLAEVLDTVKREFDRIGRDTRIGVAWNWGTPLPPRSSISKNFLSLSHRDASNDVALMDRLDETAASDQLRWVVLRGLDPHEHSPEVCGTELLKQMVAAKVGGADAIFMADVFDPDRGLLNADGSPTPQFLPWRTGAIALQGAEYLGSFNLPGGSQNHAFARDQEVVVVMWNDTPTVEEMYFGEEVTVVNLWGSQTPADSDPNSKRQRIDVGPTPIILYGCSEPIARWRLALQFQTGRLKSEYGGHEETLLGTNTFSQGVSGQARMNIPGDWQIDPGLWSLQMGAGEEFQLPMYLALPPEASLGTQTASIDFEIVADRPYKFRVYRPYQVGLGDVQIKVFTRKLPNGRLEIEQVITNETDPLEILTLRCSLFIPGYKRQIQVVTKLGRGEDRKFYYLPDADTLQGQELWLRAEQVRGRRLLNYRWKVGENSEAER